MTVESPTELRKEDRIGNVYSLEYTDISKEFFKLRHTGHYYTKVFCKHYRSLRHSCINLA